MAKITAIPMAEAVMARIDYQGITCLIEYTPEQALALATAFITATERCLKMEADFTARFLAASKTRRLGGAPGQNTGR